MCEGMRKRSSWSLYVFMPMLDLRVVMQKAHIYDRESNPLAHLPQADGGERRTQLDGGSLDLGDDSQDLLCLRRQLGFAGMHALD